MKASILNKQAFHVEMTDSALQDLKSMDGSMAFEYCGRVFESLSSLLKWVVLK